MSNIIKVSNVTDHCISDKNRCGFDFISAVAFGSVKIQCFISINSSALIPTELYVSNTGEVMYNYQEQSSNTIDYVFLIKFNKQQFENTVVGECPILISGYDVDIVTIENNDYISLKPSVNDVIGVKELTVYVKKKLYGYDDYNQYILLDKHGQPIPHIVEEMLSSNGSIFYTNTFIDIAKLDVTEQVLNGTYALQNLNQHGFHLLSEQSIYYKIVVYHVIHDRVEYNVILALSNIELSKLIHIELISTNNGVDLNKHSGHVNELIMSLNRCGHFINGRDFSSELFIDPRMYEITSTSTIEYKPQWFAKNAIVLNLNTVLFNDIEIHKNYNVNIYDTLTIYSNMIYNMNQFNEYITNVDNTKYQYVNTLNGFSHTLTVEIINGVIECSFDTNGVIVDTQILDLVQHMDIIFVENLLINKLYSLYSTRPF
jgi:hypothetical protein